MEPPSPRPGAEQACQAGWPADLKLHAALGSALRAFRDAPSRQAWRRARALWNEAMAESGPLAAFPCADDETGRLLHSPAMEEEPAGLAELPEEAEGALADQTAQAANGSEATYQRELDAWRRERAAAPPLWLAGPGAAAAGGPQSRGDECRVAPELMGTPCDEADARPPGGGKPEAGLGELLGNHLDPRRQRPLVVRGLAERVFPAGKAWRLRYLERHIGGVVVGGVRRSVAGGSVFDYADELVNKRLDEWGNPWVDESVKKLTNAMPFREFMRRLREAGAEGSDCYLWATLLEGGQAGGGGLVESELGQLLAHDVGQIRWDELEAMGGGRDEGLGQLCCCQLFCSGVRAVSASHYDLVQNVFLQLHGRKRFVLFPPVLGARALAPFPLMHARDRSARLRLERPDYGAWPHAALAQGQGVEAVLGPGDGLFLPYGWWHHVESLEQENISVNFWYSGGGLLQGLEEGRGVPAAPPLRPLPEALLVELARCVERFAAIQLGPRKATSLVAFLHWLRQGPWVASPAGREQPETEALWLHCANYILFRAAQLVPPGQLQDWFSLLDARRFLGL